MIRPPRYLTGFALSRLPQLHTDTVVIGTGVAGLQAARAAAASGEVLLLCKQAWDESDTALAQGGIAVAMAEGDSLDGHVEDTMAAGAGLCDRAMVELLVREGVERTRELVQRGLRLDAGADGAPHLTREGAHRQGRVVHIGGDATGRGLVAFLHGEMRREPRIRLLEHVLAVDLLVADGYCRGVLVHDVRSGNMLAVLAAATVLATGGAQRIYRESTAAEGITGDGIAMAFRAGAALSDLEFMQFHPTALYVAGAPRFLISEALRGEGGVLRNRRGERFMERYHEQAELAPRDIVTRAIIEEMGRTGATSVWLDATALGRAQLWERFPTIARCCQLYGIDITARPIPVRPAAHYFMGGIAVDDYGRTGVAGLYAGGEAACTGVHGANRLASNSLLEALVFSHQAAQAAKETLPGLLAKERSPMPEWNPFGATDSEEAVVVSHNWDEIRRCMWNYVGIVRTDRRLLRAQHRIDLIQQEIQEYYWNFIITSDLLELRNIATVADLIIRMALRRKESRGLHYNLDYPRADDENFHQDTVISSEGWH